MKTFQHLLTFALVGAATAAQAQAQTNTTASNAVPYEVGQGWVTHQFTSAASERWFSYGEQGRRSYCIEVVQGSLTSFKTNPKVDAYSDVNGVTPLTYTINQAGGTLTVSNDNGLGDPYFQNGARACYYSSEDVTSTNIRTFKVTAQAMPANEQALLRIRVVDTTLMARCDIRIATLGATAMPVMFMSNTTNLDLRYVPYYRGSSVPQQGGATFGSFAYSSAPSGLYARQLGANQMTFEPVPTPASTAADYWGTCYLAHNGPPDSVIATVRVPYPDPNGNVVTFMQDMRRK